eukprot:1446381-Rhodomonas_salina.4
MIASDWRGYCRLRVSFGQLPSALPVLCLRDRRHKRRGRPPPNTPHPTPLSCSPKPAHPGQAPDDASCPP